MNPIKAVREMKETPKKGCPYVTLERGLYGDLRVHLEDAMGRLLRYASQIKEILKERRPIDYLNSIPDEVFDDVFDNGLYKDSYHEIYKACEGDEYGFISNFIKYELHEVYLNHVNNKEILKVNDTYYPGFEGASGEDEEEEEEGYEEGTSSEEEISLKFE